MSSNKILIKFLVVSHMECSVCVEIHVKFVMLSVGGARDVRHNIVRIFVGAAWAVLSAENAKIF